MKRLFSLFICVVLLLSVLSGIFCVQASGPKLLAITFDDGPSKYTIPLLDGLKARNAKATFFMVGSNVKNYPDIVRRMKAEGHQLATHTMTHADLATLGTAGIQKEVFGVNERISEIVGEGKYYLRPPYGSFNATVKSAVQTPMIHWSVDTEDWRYRNAQSVYRAIINNSKDGDIILLHDLYETSVQGALLAIDDLQREGYVFVTVEQLLKRRGISPEDGKVYFDAPNTGINLPAVVSPVIATRYTVLGAKVVIGKFNEADRVYYTTDGETPNGDCPQYSKPYYVNEAQTVQAIAVGESELSDISSLKVEPDNGMRRKDVDGAFYRYRISFLDRKTQFQVGMKI